MVVGVSEGYKKELELVGVGYRASNQGNIIELALGYTHNIFKMCIRDRFRSPYRESNGSVG